MTLIATDLFKAYESERKQWSEYRAYGFVRSLGIDLTDALKDHAHQDVAIYYKNVLHMLLATQAEVTDLAVLDAAGQPIAMAGLNQQILKEHIVQKQVLLPSLDDNYDNNINLQTITFQQQNAPSSSLALLGVIMLKADASSRFYLVVAFQPAVQEPMQSIILMFCIGMVAVAGMVIWQVLSFTWGRAYLEPVAHLSSVAKSLQAGKWPANADSLEVNNQGPLFKIAQDCLKRCYAQHTFLQLQLQVLRHGLPHKATECNQIANHVEKNRSFLPDLALAAFCPPSVATFQWYIFFYAVFFVALWVGVPFMPDGVQYLFLIVFLCIPIPILPRLMVAAYIKTILAGSVVGFILGAFFHYLFNHLILTLNEGGLRIACMLVGTLGIAWVVRFSLTFRRQSS
jgi:hypothetical protein